MRARYAYDPFGRRTKVSGDVDADFGFTGLLWSPEASLSFARFRAYDPQLGRWLSRDPLRNAEVREGPNLYAYVGNEPVNNSDTEGLGVGLDSISQTCTSGPQGLALCLAIGERVAEESEGLIPAIENAPSELQACGAELEELGQQAGTVIDRLNELVSRAPDAINKYQDWLDNDINSDNVLHYGIERVNEFGETIAQISYTGPPQAWVDLANDVQDLAPELAEILSRLGYAGDAEALLPMVRKWLSGEFGVF